MNEVACGVMYNKEGKFLMGLRPDDRPYPGYWEFPGGKKEKGETIEVCLTREWMEELNLKIEIEKEIYDQTYDNYHCRFFVGRILNEEELEKNVHKAVKYLDTGDIHNLKLFENDINVLEYI